MKKIIKNSTSNSIIKSNIKDNLYKITRNVFWIAFCFFAIKKDAQAQSILDSTSTWLYKMRGNITANETGYTYFYIKGDTTIQGVNYYKRYKQEHITNVGGVFDYPETLDGFYRDDVNGFYVMRLNSTKEDTLVNNAWTLGETIPSWSCIGTISTIDTIYLGNRLLRLYDGTNMSIRLEGVGLYGYTSAPAPCFTTGTSRGYSLVCYTHQGISIGTDTTLCGVYTAVHDIFEPTKNVLEMIVAPNPFDNQVQVTFSSMVENAYYKLVTTNGQTLKEGLVNDSFLNIPTENIPQGFYMLYVYNKEGVLGITKLVK